MQLLLQLYQPLRSQVDVLQQHPATLTHTHGHSKCEYIETSETSNLATEKQKFRYAVFQNVKFRKMDVIVQYIYRFWQLCHFFLYQTPFHFVLSCPFKCII